MSCRNLIMLIALATAAMPAAGQTTRFVSIPDFLNMDFGDISGLDSYDGGANSWTQGYEDTINYVLDNVANENPDFLMSAGDLVMGHWDHDRDNRNIFGDTSTLAGQATAIDNAGDFYYGGWKQRLNDRGIADSQIFATVGDHELGDDAGGRFNQGNQLQLLDDYRREFAQHFTSQHETDPTFSTFNAGTANDPITNYAVQRGNVKLITLDQFNTDGSGNVQGLSTDQINWLNTELADAETDASIDHVFVQGHMPVDDSPTVPARNSSQLKFPGGTSSTHWQTLVSGGADIFFAGEVHDDSVRNNAGEDLIQVITGGIVGESYSTQYLVGTVDGDVITLEVKDIALTNIGSSSSSGGLWQTGSNRPHEDVAVANPAAAPQTIGTLTIDKSSGQTVFSNATGTFAALASPIDPGEGPSGAWLFEEGAGDTTDEKLRGITSDVFGSGVSFTSDTAAPDSDSALSFDSSTDAVITNVTGVQAGLAGQGGKTITAWVKTSAATGRQTLFSYSPTNGQGKGEDLRLLIQDGNMLKLEASEGAKAETDDVNLADGTWRMVAAIIPPGAQTRHVSFFIDGSIFEDEADVSELIDTASSTSGDGLLDIVLGTDQPSNNTGFEGLLDDVHVFNQALTFNELELLRTTGAIPEPTSLALIGLGGVMLAGGRRRSV